MAEGTFCQMLDYSYLWGEEVTVSASPDGDSVFAGWSGSLTGMANPATITMNGDQTVTANFELKKFSVTFNAGAHGLVQEGTNSPTNSITQQVKWGQIQPLLRPWRTSIIIS